MFFFSPNTNDKTFCCTWPRTVSTTNTIFLCSLSLKCTILSKFNPMLIRKFFHLFEYYSTPSYTPTKNIKSQKFVNIIRYPLLCIHTRSIDYTHSHSEKENRFVLSKPGTKQNWLYRKGKPINGPLSLEMNVPNVTYI